MHRPRLQPPTVSTRPAQPPSPTLPNVQRPRWTLLRAFLTRLPEAHPCVFLPVQLFAPRSPVSATGKEIGSRDGTRRSTSLSTDGAAQSCLPGHLQPSHLFPAVGSSKARWPWHIPMEEEARAAIWCRHIPLSPPLPEPVITNPGGGVGPGACPSRRQQ